MFRKEAPKKNKIESKTVNGSKFKSSSWHTNTEK